MPSATGQLVEGVEHIPLCDVICSMRDVASL